MRIEINYLNKKITVSVKQIGFLSRGLGLMFKSKNTENLLFSFDKDVSIIITSFFCFFSFLVIWLDKNNHVIDFKLVRPFHLSIRPKKNFRKFVEIPLNSRNKEFIELFVDKEKI